MIRLKDERLNPIGHVSGGAIYDRKGQKVGEVDGDLVRNLDHQVIYSAHDDSCIWDSNHSKVAEVRNNIVRDSRWKIIGHVEGSPRPVIAGAALLLILKGEPHGLSLTQCSQSSPREAYHSSPPLPCGDDIRLRDEHSNPIGHVCGKVIYDRKGSKVGEVDGNRVRNLEHQAIYFAHDDTYSIWDSNHSLVAEVRKNTVRDSMGNIIGHVEGGRRPVIGGAALLLILRGEPQELILTQWSRRSPQKTYRAFSSVHCRDDD